MRRHLAVLVPAALLLGLVGVVGPGAGPAAADGWFKNFSITINGGYGDTRYTPRNAAVGLVQTNADEDWEITVTDKRETTLMTFDFSSRGDRNQRLGVDYYDYAQQAPNPGPGRPGISMHHLGFCNSQSGNFEIRDLQKKNGQVTRLWLTYVRFCDGADPAFGEIRLGYPKQAYDVSSRVVRWPSDFAGTSPGETSYDVPVRVRRTSADPVTVRSVAVTGRNAADFPVRSNGCTGQLTRSGCTVKVGFAPTGAGPRHAGLEVVTSAGTTTVSLDGFGAPGVSDWKLDLVHDESGYSDEDEHLVLPVSASLGSPYSIASGATGSGRWWRTNFHLNPGGTRFAEGGHYAWTSDIQPPLVVSLAEGDAGCEVDGATLDLPDLAFTGPDEDLSRMQAALHVHCKSSAAYAVDALVRFHERDDVTAPAAVGDLRAVRSGSRVVLRWANPAAADLAGVLVRWYPGRHAPRATDGGRAVHDGTSTAARFSVPRRQPVAVAVWTYDATGNVGARRTLVVKP